MSNNKRQKNAETVPSLLKVLLLDIFVRHWTVSVLALLFIASSMQLAKTAHDARRLTAEWQNLRQADQDEQVIWESLRLELTSLSEVNRISTLAKKQLGMVEVKGHNEKVIAL